MLVVGFGVQSWVTNYIVVMVYFFRLSTRSCLWTQTLAPIACLARRCRLDNRIGAFGHQNFLSHQPAAETQGIQIGQNRHVRIIFEKRQNAREIEQKLSKKVIK
jgi:hypothetical protein